MKSERRHELQHNLLEDYVAKVGQRVKPYARAITGGILAVLVLIGTYIYLNRRADAERAAAWQRTWEAINSRDTKEMRDVIDGYPNTPAALWAQLALADQELAGGVNSLFSEKSAGKNSIHSALEDYQAVEQAATDPLLQQHALYGIGRAQESLNQLDKAKEAFERLTKNYPDGPYSARAKQELDALALDSTKTFYDWFANVEPPARGIGPGADGSGKNPFEGLPPLPPDLKLPGTGASKTPPSEPKPDEGPAKTPSSTAPKSTDTKPADAKPIETKPAETKPGDSKPAETKPSDSKPAETKPNTKPSDSKSTDTKSGDTNSSDTKPGEPKPGETKPADSKL